MATPTSSVYVYGGASTYVLDVVNAADTLFCDVGWAHFLVGRAKRFDNEFIHMNVGGEQYLIVDSPLSRSLVGRRLNPRCVELVHGFPVVLLACRSRAATANVVTASRIGLMSSYDTDGQPFALITLRSRQMAVIRNVASARRRLLSRAVQTIEDAELEALMTDLEEEVRSDRPKKAQSINKQ